VPRGRLVERRGDDLAPHRALHLGDFLRALVDQQHDQNHVRMIGRDGVGHVLQHHGLARLRTRHQQAALALADRRDDVDQAPGDVLVATHVPLQHERLVGEKRREVLEQDPVLGRIRSLPVDLVNLDQREVALAVLGRAHFTLDRVAGVQREAANLRGRNVDVVGAGEVGRLGRAQKAESVRQHLQGSVAEDRLAGLGALFQDRKHQLLLAHPVRIVDFQAGCHFEQGGYVERFQFGQLHGRGYREGCG